VPKAVVQQNISQVEALWFENGFPADDLLTRGRTMAKKRVERSMASMLSRLEFVSGQTTNYQG
jgi:hypothetical protein